MEKPKRASTATSTKDKKEKKTKEKSVSKSTKTLTSTLEAKTKVKVKTNKSKSNGNKGDVDSFKSSSSSSANSSSSSSVSNSNNISSNLIDSSSLSRRSSLFNKSSATPSKKRKKLTPTQPSNREIKSLKEQIEDARQEIKKNELKIPQLEKKLAKITADLKKLNNCNIFKIGSNNNGNSNISLVGGSIELESGAYFSLLDQQAALKEEIEYIKSGKELKEFEEQVASLDLDKFQAADVENKISFRQNDVNTFVDFDISSKRRRRVVKPNKIQIEDINKDELFVDEEAPFMETADDEVVNEDNKNDNVKTNEIKTNDVKLNEIKTKTSTNKNDDKINEKQVVQNNYTPLKDVDSLTDQDLFSQDIKSNELKLLKKKPEMRRMNKYFDKLTDQNLLIPQTTNKFICSTCDLPLTHSEEEAILTCPRCASFSRHIDTSNNMAQFNNPTKAPNNERWNESFNQILSHFKIETWVLIPLEDLEFIRERARILGLSTDHISITNIVDILKKEKKKSTYKNIVQVYSILNGVPVPPMPLSLENEFKQAFKLLQAPWEKHKGKRKTFTYHHLTFKKLCKRLKHEEFLPFIDVARSTKSLMEQEKIWEKMCGELNWTYENDLY